MNNKINRKWLNGELKYPVKTKKRFGKGIRVHWCSVYNSVRNKRMEHPIWGRPIGPEMCVKITFPI